jgi:tetratricopeptide (TPR) repeat protein
LGVEKDAMPIDSYGDLKWHYRMLSSISQISRSKPTLIVIEDIQWADTGTIAFIHFVARNIVNTRVLILISMRSEILSSGSETSIQLRECINLMRNEGTVREMILEPLSLESTGKIVESILHGPIEVKAKERIFSESGGNPLFISELTKMMVSTSYLFIDENIWRMSNEQISNIPKSVKDIVLKRLDGLKPEEEYLIESASVQNYSFDAGVLAQILDMPQHTVEAILNRFENDLQIITGFDGTYYFNHDIVRKSIESKISEGKKIAIHRATVHVIDEDSKEMGDLVRLSYHYYHGGLFDEACNSSYECGKYFLMIGMAQEALLYFLRTNDSLNREIKTDTLKFPIWEFHEKWGDAYAMLYQNELCIQQLNECLVRTDDPRSRTRIYRKLSECYKRLGFSTDDLSKAKDFMGKALDSCVDDQDELAELMSTKAAIAFHESDFINAIEYSKKAASLFHDLNKTEYESWELSNQSLMCFKAGRFNDAMEKAELAQTLLNEGCAPYSKIQVYLGLADIYYFLGRFDEAMTFYRTTIDLSKVVGSYEALCYTYGFLSSLYGMKNDKVNAFKSAAQGVESSRINDNNYTVIKSNLWMIHAYLMDHDVPNAELLLERTEALLESETLSDKLDINPLFHFILSELYGTKGLIGICLSEYRIANETAERIGSNPMIGVLGTSWLIKILMIRNEDEMADEMYQKLFEQYSKIGNLEYLERLKSFIHED